MGAIASLHADSFASREPLALATRLALEHLVADRRDRSGAVSGTVIGDPVLMSALHQYARVQDCTTALISLDAPPDAIERMVLANQPETVVVMGPGRLGSRAAVMSPARRYDLPASRWRSLGYRHVRSTAVRGPLALVWAVADRCCRSMGRSDLADRCRFVMLRTASRAPGTSGLATIVIREYQRA